MGIANGQAVHTTILFANALAFCAVSQDPMAFQPDVYTPTSGSYATLLPDRVYIDERPVANEASDDWDSAGALKVMRAICWGFAIYVHTW